MKAKRFLKKLDKSIQDRIIQKVEKLRENPQLGVPLIGHLSGLRKLRIGQYKVIYNIIEQRLVVVVLDIGHRKNIYN